MSVLTQQEAAVRKALGLDSYAGRIAGPAVKTYNLELSAPEFRRLVRLVAKTASGTLTVSVQIDGVDVTGLAGLGVTTATTTWTATALRTAAAGARIALVVSAVAAPTDWDFSLHFSRQD